MDRAGVDFWLFRRLVPGVSTKPSGTADFLVKLSSVAHASTKSSLVSLYLGVLPVWERVTLSDMAGCFAPGAVQTTLLIRKTQCFVSEWEKSYAIEQTHLNSWQCTEEVD